MIRYTLQSSGIGEPSVYHALVVIFLEFFAWGLLTMPVIAVSEALPKDVNDWERALTNESVSPPCAGRNRSLTKPFQTIRS